MPKLIFSLNNVFLGEFPLDKDRITLGRRPSNDVHVDSLAVSGEHAVIKVIGRDAFLEDLGSTNGTHVNGNRIQQHLLQDGDIIHIGKYQLQYVTAAGGNAPMPPQTQAKAPAGKAPASKAEVQPQPAVSAESVSAEPAPAEAAKASRNTARNAEPQNVGRVRVLTGTNTGKELLLNKAVTTLGKPGVQVAVITRRSQGYVITHVEGQSHPKVNGKAIGVQAHALNDRDTIELAGVRMEFYLIRE